VAIQPFVSGYWDYTTFVQYSRMTLIAVDGRLVRARDGARQT